MNCPLNQVLRSLWFIPVICYRHTVGNAQRELPELKIHAYISYAALRCNAGHQNHGLALTEQFNCDKVAMGGSNHALPPIGGIDVEVDVAHKLLPLSDFEMPFV